MDAGLRELLDLFVRWIHLIAGIMWIGNSMLFNWLDRNLVRQPEQGERSFGTIWLLHSGAYYEVEKKLVSPAEFPRVLHWFKWQSYTTWMSGFALLILVYHLGGTGAIVDPERLALSAGQASALSLGLLAGGWALYDGLWRALKQHERAATALSLALALGLVVGLPQLLAPKAAYLHLGALLGSLMAGNVFFHIIPSQKQMVAATLRGELADRALSVAAKTRSIHNNYMTWPVLVLMLSAHFPGVYGHAQRELLLGILVLGGATARHVLNVRFGWPQWKPVFAAVVAATVLGVGAVLQPGLGARTASHATDATDATGADIAAERVAWPVVEAVLAQRCLSCHAEQPTDPTYAAPAGGMRLDSPARAAAAAARIRVRAVETRTMPQGNKTGITQEERDLLGRWIAEGAQVPQAVRP